MNPVKMPEFDNLNYEQNEVIQKLFAYKLGLVQVFTGFG